MNGYLIELRDLTKELNVEMQHQIVNLIVNNKKINPEFEMA